MILLPGFILALMLAKINAGTTDSQAAQHLRCPGECKVEHTCSTTLNETDCDHGLVCCVDHFEDITTTEFADLDLTTQTLESTTAEMEDYTTAAMEESGEEYTYAYSNEDMVVEHELDNVNDEDVSDSCPGTCQSYETAASCKYVIATENVCPPGFSCCVTEADMRNTNDQYVYEIEDESAGLVERESELPNFCPGTCVHPSHAMFCQEILPQFSCPLNAKCCVQSTMERSLPDSPIQCTGQCLSPSMYGYCFPPSEIVLGETTCPHGSACCMSMQSAVNPQSVNRMQFPGFPQNFVSDPSSVMLGHLAIDDTGTIFKVSPYGQTVPLPKLTPPDHVTNVYAKVTTHPWSDGEITIFSDASGGLYQQFFPRQSLTAPETQKIRQPASQFQSQAEAFKDSIPVTDDDSEDVIIPDDDDEAPVTTSTPIVYDDKSSRPPCPGSCISYFLRFTCFRGHATYDGFTCPGRRSVCCARLKDIQEHEDFLKSLSPYFNAPPVSRDTNLPRCGLKGRRDSSRSTSGKESLPGEWCWQAAVINVQNQYICGGALIDNSWVLTAAHCVVEPIRDNQALFVRVGVTDLKSREDNARGQTIRVLSTFVHHNFDSTNLDNDVALLRLQKPVELNNGVCIICLPTSMPKEGAECTVTGYGFVSKDGDMSLKIMEAQVPIINSIECMTNVTEALKNPFILPSSSFCAGGQQDVCQGDAGGPLVCEAGGYHELAGLVSWGLGCGRDYVPSIYVKVHSFMGWINQIISTSSVFVSLN